MKNEDRILFISSSYLFFRNGGALATLAYYKAIQNIYNSERVDVILPREKQEKAVDNEKFFFEVPNRNRIIAGITLLFGHLHRFRRYTITHIKKYPNKYKLCIINGGKYAGDMIDDIQSCNIKVIVIHHNYEKEYHVTNKTIESFFGLFPYYIIRNERNAYKKADLNLFLTQADKELFQRNYGECSGKTDLIGVFEQYPQTLPLLEKNKKKIYTIVITGSMNSYQTECGILDFYKNYYDSVFQEYPNVKILIAGRNPTEKIINIAKKEKDKITIISNPEKMEDIIENGIIYFCPTNIGGGLKLRIMDGLRQGLPILTHKVSSRGYDAFFDKSYFKIYSDKKTFREGFKSIMDLYNSNKINSQQIQDDYKEYFSFEAGFNRFKAILYKLNIK